ncbi:MAG TPA: hypothetical protein VKZ91_01855 [Woeseiaceae bacterium]|nr:hypothetical protein [Woeseiaceae bacterium]
MQRLLNGGGITVTEIAPMDGPVDVCPETIAAFVGRALRGPLNTPVLLRNFAEFRRRFGGIWPRSSLGIAVEQFFDHGGKQLYVVRVANGARGAMICIPAEHGMLVLRAVEPGSTESIRASVDYDAIIDQNPEHFNLTLQRVSPDTGLVLDQEIYRRLSCDAEDRNFIGNALAGSEIARPQLPLPTGRPRPTTDVSNRFDPGYAGHAQAGSDGWSLTDYDLVGSAVAGTGLFALNQVERFDLLYLPPPGVNEPGPAAILAAELYCRRRGAMLLLDPPAAWTSVANAVSGVRQAAYASPNILSYFPRMYCRIDDGAPPRAVGGALAGLLCKLDRNYGQWGDLDQPDLALRRDLVPAVEVTDEEARQLAREGLNGIAGKAGRAVTVKGSVTLARNCPIDRKFGSLAVRRLCLTITNAIERATRWAVFQPNATQVAERIQSQVHAYLSCLADAGAFAGDDFIVQCDAGLHNGPNHPERGVTILLRFRPVGAADAVSLTLHQGVSGCRVATTAFASSLANCA